MDKYLLIFGMSHLYFNFLMENDIYFEYDSVCVFFFLYVCAPFNDCKWYSRFNILIWFVNGFFRFLTLRNVNWDLRHLSGMSLVRPNSNIYFRFKTNSPRPSTCSYTRNIGKTIINRFSNGTCSKGQALTNEVFRLILN